MFRPLRACLLLTLLLPVVLITGCSSPPPVPQGSGEDEVLRKFMDTSPSDGKLFFLGVAGIRSRRQESIDLALEEAARRLAMFHEVEGEFSTLSNRGGRLLDYRAETSASLTYDGDYKNYLEDLEFNNDTDVLESENAVFVRARYSGSLNIGFNPSMQGQDGKPFWIETPPAMIGDYTVGVGFAGRRNAHKDTVIASCENAVFSVICNVAAVSWGQNFDYRGVGFLAIASGSTQRLDASASLSEFYVLDTWTDPADKSVWTLAIAKKIGEGQ